MGDSQNPLYQKGYRAGRTRTEAEQDEMRNFYSETKKLRREQWLDAMASFIASPVLTASWRLNEDRIADAGGYARLAAIYADEVIQLADKKFGKPRL